MKIRIYIVLLLTTIVSTAVAQYPHCFRYDNENGLPSNQVYSIVQDQKGFIWLGCDAGLYKFDGVRYVPYKSKTQNSKSITGLTLSSSERMYCYNFRSQLFCLEKDTLKELKVDFYKINYLTCDQKGNLYVTHGNGISQYNEVSKKWTHYNRFANGKTILGTSSATVVNENEIHFLTAQGMGVLHQGKLNIARSDCFGDVGSLLMRKAKDALFVFSVQNERVYTVKNKVVSPLKSASLSRALQNRKITNAVYLSDNHLWISTYKGIVKYNPETDSVVLLYPELSFSACMIDREGNYWFTTLQNGLVRVPNLNFIVWNKENDGLSSDQINKLTTDHTHVYFATINGTIGKLSTQTNQLQTFTTGNNADVQSLEYDSSEKRLYFNINNHLYFLKDDHIGEVYNEISTFKSIKKVHNDHFILSSYGTYVKGNENYKLSEAWSRELQHDERRNIVWIATNEGLLKCMKEGTKWVIKQTLFPNTQILSIDFDNTKQVLYSLSFDGRLLVDKTTGAQLPENVQGNKLTYSDNTIYIATNKGVWMYDLLKKQWSNFNALSGLASENVNAIIVLNQNLWLATGKGLQKIPLSEIKKTPRAKIHLHNAQTSFQIRHDEVIVLKPSASIYSANGKFEYAYRVNKQKWIKLPATIGQIELQNLPTGTVQVELKTIDHLGRDSENTIVLNGFVKPPFYKTWWFVLCLVILSLVIVLLIVKRMIRTIRKREQEKTQLANSQLTALKAQMNPHFIFNVLNSIKSYIYENDKEKATEYLDDFSELVRKILENSEVQYAYLEDDLKTLTLYIELEAMMLSGDFSYTISVDPAIDPQTKIPAMILQPYIENAFKHGLRHQKGAKKLTIGITPWNNTGIAIEIADNGIGREATAEINLQNTYKKASFATRAIEKRMELINAQGNQQLEIETNDLKEGTQVIIWLTHINE